MPENGSAFKLLIKLTLEYPFLKGNIIKINKLTFDLIITFLFFKNNSNHGQCVHIYSI